jgi:phospholipase/lecithinase/hemolysin
MIKHYAISVRRHASLLVGAVCLSVSAASSAIPFSDIYVFGDSLSDTGNVREVVPLGNTSLVATLAGYGPNGRFSNGPVWHEYLAQALGLPAATPSENGGNNYAYGGARVDSAGNPSAGVLTQVNRFTSNTGGGFGPDDLVITWAGGNDMRDLVGNADPLASIENSLNTLIGVVSGFISSGASTLLVPNLPDLGNIPEFRTTPDAGSGTFVSTAWNAGLESRLNDLAATTTAAIYYFDVFSIFDDIIADPAAFGFTNTTDQCRSTSFTTILGFPIAGSESACAGADGFVFWDEIHPTTAAHEQLGLNAFALLSEGSPLGQARIPAPMTLWIMLLGMAMLLVARRTAVRV